MEDLECKTCKHWRFIREDYGECHKVEDHSDVHYADGFPKSEQAVLWASICTNLNELDEWASNLKVLEGESMAKEGYGIENSLITRETFGCKLYERG